MRGLVIFLLTLVVIAFFSFVVVSMNDINNLIKTIQENQENKIVEFSTFTSAVCENKKDAVNCKDEIFVKCNGQISKAVDGAECNGIKIDVPKATGAAVFGNDWKDPRV